MRSSRWDKEFKSSAVYGHMLSLVGHLLHQLLKGKLGKSVLQTNSMIRGKRGAKKGRERLMAVSKTRKEFCLGSVRWYLTRQVVTDATMRFLL